MANNIIFMDDIRDGAGSRITRDFLNTLTKKYVGISSSYYKDTGEHCFIYREKQLQSMLVASLSKMTNSFMGEVPVDRNKFKKSSRQSKHVHFGLVDFWAHYKNIHFIVEVKHGYFSPEHGVPTKDINRKWEHAIKQTTSIDNKFLNAYLENNDKGIVKCALLVCTHYYTESLRDKYNNYKADKLHNDLINGLQQTPTWHACWKLGKSMLDPDPDTKEIYPAVTLAARTITRIRH